MSKRIWAAADAGADFSPCRQYRYRLWRIIKPQRYLIRETVSTCSFIGLNPSTADEYTDDPTVKRCWKYAERWGFDVFNMLNLHPFRSTDPQPMKRHIAPLDVLNANYATIREVCRSSDLIVCAWGTHGSYQAMDSSVMYVLSSLPGIQDRAFCLGFNSDGTPKHPLYLRSDAERVQMFRAT